MPSTRDRATGSNWLKIGLRLPLVLAAAVLILYAVLFADGADLRVLAIAGTYALLVLGYQFIFGHAGALSLAQAAFFGLGAYATAIMGARYGLDLPATLALSIAVPVALAAIVALLVLRLESHYFALATLGVSQLVWLAAINFEGITGGRGGLAGVPGIELFGRTATGGWGELAVVWGAVAIGGLVLWQITRGLYGLGFQIMRAEPLAAAAAGINATGLRFAAFLLSAAYGGLAGALHVRLTGVVSPDALALPMMVACLTMAVVGGRTRIAGAVVGAVFGAVLLIQTPERLGVLEDYTLIAIGAALLLMIVLAPEGLVGALTALRARLVPEAPPAAPKSAGPYLPRLPQRGTLLEVKQLTRRFGGVLAVDEVDLEIRRSEIFGLIGQNGSGKTTLANLMTGIERPDYGRVWLDEREITDLSPWRVARAGIGRSYQSPALVETMTALDNVAAAGTATEGAGLLTALATLGHDRRLADARANAMALLSMMGAADVAMAPCSALPHGLRRRVEIARALALAPVLLILDEPAAGLTEGERADLAERLGALTEDGLSLLIIEHNMPFLMKLATRMACLDEGRIIATGTPAAVANDSRVIEAYLGAAPAAAEVA